MSRLKSIRRDAELGCGLTAIAGWSRENLSRHATAVNSSAIFRTGNSCFLYNKGEDSHFFEPCWQRILAFQTAEVKCVASSRTKELTAETQGRGENQILLCVSAPLRLKFVTGERRMYELIRKIHMYTGLVNFTILFVFGVTGLLGTLATRPFQWNRPAPVT
jgi:hypothetical protein